MHMSEWSNRLSQRQRFYIPKLLVTDLWFAEKPRNEEPKIGKLDAVRLSVPEGMLSRATIKDDPVLADSSIIRMPQSTVFRLEEPEQNGLRNYGVVSYRPRQRRARANSSSTHHCPGHSAPVR